MSEYGAELLKMSHDSTKLMINAEAEQGLMWVAMQAQIVGMDLG